MPAGAASKKRAAPSGSAQQAAGKKRKMPKNYYAVRVGVQPGIYQTWPECQMQINGFKGASYKGFETLDEAKAFLRDRTQHTGKFYAVARGNVTGIFQDWSEASKAIQGATKPAYKGFATREEAEQYIREYGDEATIAALDDDDDDSDDDDDDDDDDDEPPAKIIRKLTKGEEVLPSNVPLPKPKGDVLYIYTDGSSLGNGKVGATAGIGVFFAKNDPRNVSERLQGEPQTNQRAELAAILRALEVVSDKQSVKIFSDSKYAIQCVTEWVISWEKKGWTTAKGEVKNQDLIKGVRAKILKRETYGTQTVFQWVKGHATDIGNMSADQLAVQGAKLR